MNKITSPKDSFNLGQIPDWKNEKEMEQLPRRFNISVIGLGYVGAVSVACLASCGHTLIGVDKDKEKAKRINAGVAPIVEENLAELLSEGLLDEKISATTSIADAMAASSISFVCVGTPSNEDGSCDLSILKSVISEMATEIAHKETYHTVVIRSTIPPKTCHDVLLPILEEVSGKQCGEGFGLCFHPEFLREGVAIQDFYSPPKTVIGSMQQSDAKKIAEIYTGIDDNCILTSLEAAEAVKYVDNTWHAVKVSFANEIGKICQAKDIDSHEVMDIFCQDTKLNLSPYYMKPGFAYGGSCLPKDVRSMNNIAQQLGVDTPLLNSINVSNQAQIEHAIQMIETTGKKKIGFLGVTFKADTDDLRESPVMPVISHFLAKQKAGEDYEIRVHDPNLNASNNLAHYKMHAKTDQGNANLCLDHMDEIHEKNLAYLYATSDVLVVFHDTPEYRKLVIERESDQHLVDLVRIFKPFNEQNPLQNAGMNDYIQKPFNKQDLIGTLENWIGKGPSQDDKSILIVEDNPAVAAIAKAILANHKIDATVAKDGQEALARLEEKNFNAVLMDIALPKMNGTEVTQHIRRREDAMAYIPVIAMTSYAAPEESRTYQGICW